MANQQHPASVAPVKRDKVLAKIVRMLNDQHRTTMAGFYGSAIGGRYFQARARDGHLEVTNWDTWIRVPDDKILFHDHNGNTIVLPTLLTVPPVQIPPPPMDRLRREVREVFTLQAETVTPAPTAPSGHQRLMWDILQGGAR